MDIRAEERKDADEEDAGREKDDADLLPPVDGYRGEVFVRRVHPGTYHQLQVVVKRYHVVDAGEGDDEVGVGVCGTFKEEKFADESGEWRDSSEAERGDGRGDGQTRAFLRKAGEGVEAFRTLSLIHI